jgi:hypothetical protein
VALLEAASTPGQGKRFAALPGQPGDGGLGAVAVEGRKPARALRTCELQGSGFDFRQVVLKCG